MYSVNFWKWVFWMVFVGMIFSSCGTWKDEGYAHSTIRKSKMHKVRTKYPNKSKKYNAIGSVSGQRKAIVSTAKKYLGTPYSYGGKKPSSGFDCSGFTSFVFQKNGIALVGASYNQAKTGKRKSKNALIPGDLIFFGHGNKVTHVGIVADTSRGRIKIIHSSSSRGVVIDDITLSDYWQKRFLFGRDVISGTLTSK